MGKRNERGFTLIEVMVAGFVLVVGVAGAVTLVNGANRTTSMTKAREAATNVARQLLESSRSIPYSQLLPTSITAQLQAQPGLSDAGAGAGWTIQRRAINYSVVASVCVMDDPADGTGVHPGALYCADSAPAGAGDTNPDDYKRVTVDVSWRDASGAKSVRQTGIVDNPGNAAGPAVTSFAIAKPNVSPITSNIATVSFDVGTDSPAATVAWSVDGSSAGQASGGGTSWSFPWAIGGLSEGTYTITAQAYDTGDQPGASRSLTVTLNRNAPLAPKGLAAGRNGAVVDLEWLPNAERDIIGYHVKRVVPGGTDVVVCDTASSDCIDPNPPSGVAVSYYVQAVDLDQNGSKREGAASATVTASQTNRPPSPPTNLLASNNGSSTTLIWTASPGDPDTGDHIAFYRIYRDGVAYANRYDRTGLGTDTSYVDTRTGGMPHSYSITAVDTQLAESPLLGPVTR